MWRVLNGRFCDGCNGSRIVQETPKEGETTAHADQEKSKGVGTPGIQGSKPPGNAEAAHGSEGKTAGAAGSSS